MSAVFVRLGSASLGPGVWFTGSVLFLAHTTAVRSFSKARHFAGCKHAAQWMEYVAIRFSYLDFYLLSDLNVILILTHTLQLFKCHLVQEFFA